jgi:endonuclease YncB( thermonuclease family)
MNYRVEIKDAWNRRVAVFDDVPLLEATRDRPGGLNQIRGILPKHVTELGHGHRVELWLEDELFVRANVTQLNPVWADTKKLILERFVDFHNTVTFEAEWTDDEANVRVKSSHQAETVDEIVKRSINRALGPIHYGVAHTAYPDGATREYQKLLARKTSANELETGGIAAGQWVSGARIDATSAYAKDGDTIAGLVVDGVTWPDLRMMMIDTQETSINSHTLKLHPEVAEWSTADYNASGYKVAADAATDFLQHLMDTKGIDLIELNPHRGSNGLFDDRVDKYGRYLGLVCGGGECFNAGLVEQGLADVLNYEDGRYHQPEMELKDFYSYTGVQVDTVEATAQELVEVDANIGIYPWLTTLAYAAGGYGWSMSQDFCIEFRALHQVDRVLFLDPVLHGIEWESDSEFLVNALQLDGNQTASTLNVTVDRDLSIAIYGERLEHIDNGAFVDALDGTALLDGLLDDVAYPELRGAITFYHGDPTIQQGDLIEVRDGLSARVRPELADEWGGRFSGRLVARVAKVVHTLEGNHLKTVAELTSPLRTMERPLRDIVDSQAEAGSQFELRLDDALAGLDTVYHLD